jgi:hypothetical protein
MKQKIKSFGWKGMLDALGAGHASCRQGESMQHVPDHVVATAQAPPRLLQELRETLQRLRLGGPFYVLLWLLAGVAADLWLRAPVAFSLITFGFVALTVVRFRVHGLAEGTQEDDVRGRLDFIWLLLLVNAGLWGAASDMRGCRAIAPWGERAARSPRSVPMPSPPRSRTTSRCACGTPSVRWC